MDDDVPPELLANHPELAGVHDALAQLGRGEPVTAPCTVCGATLLIDEVATTGALVIRCPDGHTFFRARRAATPMLVVFEVEVLPSGELALGPPAQRCEMSAPTSLVGQRITIALRDGAELETHVVDVSIHTALSGQRNVYVKIRGIAEPTRFSGAIIRVALISMLGVDRLAVPPRGGPHDSPT